MSAVDGELGPVKAWIEPDRWALLRVFPLGSVIRLTAAVAAGTLGLWLHPAFFLLTLLSLLRHAAADASLRDLFRDGMLHPAVVVDGARGLLATLVRLEDDGRAQDAVVISRMPRRWTGREPPWGGARAAMVIAGDPPRLRPLSTDFAIADPGRGKRAAERIPAAQWQALSRALAQLEDTREGVHPVELGHEPWYGSVSALEADGSLPEHLGDAGCHAWCAGFPALEQPAMAPEEAKRVRRLRARAWLELALLAAGLLATGVGLVLLAGSPSHHELAALVLGGLIPLLVYAALQRLLRVRAYGQDLAEGNLWRFGGTISSFDSLGLDRDLARLTRRGVLVPEPGAAQDFVVLKHASELLHANGRWVSSRVRLHVGHVAAPPLDPVKLTLPRELRSSVQQPLEVGRRRLTEPEREELVGRVERVRRPGVGLLVLTVFAYATLFVWSQHDFALSRSLSGAPMVFGMWLLAAQAAFRRARFAAKLRRDVELGWVITVDHPRDPQRDEPELPARGVERLLHARLDWTVNRRPASWRRHG